MFNKNEINRKAVILLNSILFVVDIFNVLCGALLFGTVLKFRNNLEQLQIRLITFIILYFTIVTLVKGFFSLIRLMTMKYFP